jgi:hypothetical protein
MRLILNFCARSVITTAILIFLTASSSLAQERPYFATYDHYLEEPGNLEIGLATTTGVPKQQRSVYTAPWLELVYGVKGWWTTELYLEGVTTTHDGSGFVGWRWENRFRLLKTEHRINPVLYIEYEHVSEASRIQKEIVGEGSLAFEPIASLRKESANELEAKAIFSSALRSWNLAENFIFEKNLSAEEGVEFGYSIGVSRPLADLAGGSDCRFCAENFVAGVELFGGLGSTEGFGVDGTRHYIAPVLAWRTSARSSIKGSVGFGLTQASDHVLFRLGWSYEFAPRRSR